MSSLFTPLQLLGLALFVVLVCISLIFPRESETQRLDRLRKVFKQMDANGDGKVNVGEFFEAVHSIPDVAFAFIGMTVKQAVKDADTDGDGVISWEEFLAWMNKREGLDSKKDQ